MRRREFIALIGSAAAWQHAAHAQQVALPVVGFLSPGSVENDRGQVGGFRRGLAEAGYIEGRNVKIEYRWAEARYDRLPELASDLVRHGVNVIAACGSSAPGLAAKEATSTIPIVFQTGADPVADRLVASMNQPGGNVTGVSRMTLELEPKRVELLHDTVPKVDVFALLLNRGSPRADAVVDQVQKAAQSLGLRIVVAKVGADNELESAFATIARVSAGALLISNDPVLLRWMEKIVALATRGALPAMSNDREYAAAGGLMSYDSSLIDSFRQVGVYVGRILKGEKPANLPVLQPTKFELVINLKTAKVLGLTIPQPLLVAADEVIE
jgi:putative tryptophan/tyrosine transport system substrate-binding protein